MKKTIKVLIVEDSENDAALLISALQRGGYDPVYKIVETPEAMADALNRQEWDLVISEYSMPRFSGLDALKLLQDKDPDLSFILITGQVGEDVAVEAMKAGAHDYILKSNPARLIPAVERELREAVMRRERRQAEKALQESEIRLRQITDNMLDMISLVDARGVFQYASPSHKNMLGYEPEFLIGKSILELSHLYHPDDVGRVFAEVDLHTIGLPIKYRLRHSDGHYHWLESVGNQFYDENCCLKGSVCTTRDITRRKLTEQALQRERDFSGAVLDMVGALVIVLDRKGRIIRFNRACESVTGYSFEEMQGKIIWDTLFALEDDKKSFKAIFKKLCSGKYPLDGENFWLTKKGNRRLITRKNTVLLNETSEVEYIIGTGLGITEQRESENELGLRTQLLNSTNDSIVLHDFEGRFHYVNEVACRFYGYTREEMMQKNVFELNTPESAKDQQFRNNELKTKGRCVFEAVNSRKDGSCIPIEVNARVNDIGGKQFVLSVARDITERKHAEEALRKSGEKYLMIFNTTGTAAVIVEEDTTISLVNSEFETSSGYSKGEIEGKKSWKEFFIKDYLDDMIRYHNLRRVDPDSAPKQYETGFITRKGDVKQVIVTVSMIPGTNQSIGFLLDISGIKQAEKATNQSEEKFRTLFEEAPVGIGISRAGKTLMANQAYLNMFGYASVTELEGTPVLDQIAPQCRTQVEEIARGREQGKEAPSAYETVGLKKDSSQYPLYIETARIELPDGTATIVYFTDITESKRAEAELRFSEERFSKAFNACPGPMSISTFPDGRYIDVNESFLQVLGYRRGEVVGFTRSELNIWDKPEDLERATQSLYEKKSFRDLEASFRTKSGELRIGLISADILEISGEDYMLAVFEDITERKMAEEALKKSEEKYRSLVVNLNDVIFTINAEGYVTYISPVIERFAGYKAMELIGKPFMPHVHPEDRQGLLESFRRSLSGQMEPFEFRLFRKDGTSIYVRSFSRVLAENGQVSLTGVLSDITERKQAEKALRLSEERFFQAFRSSPCAMSITHLPDFRIIDVNQRWLDSTGFSREDVVGKLREEMNVWTEQQRQQARESLNEYGSVTNLETVFRNKKGEERYGLWSGEIITLDGEPCLLGATIDITERKKYEKEVAWLDRLNLMGEIAGGIAHEIRNPMTVVRGYLQIMQLNEEFASQKKRFDAMIGEIDRANAIITEFLSLSKNEPTELKRQSINSIVTALEPLIRADAANNQVAVSVDLADVPDLNMDEKQIKQLVLNLVRNGIEAMSRHGELTIKTSRKKGRIVLSIKDRGNGIPPEVLEKLGTPFFTTKEKGTGLGLPVCYRIAESHNARIEIKTGKRGTTVMVSFKVPSLQDE